MTLRIGVLGGGLAGLSAAFRMQYLLKDRVSITVLEAMPRLGGWIHSIPQYNGLTMHECGPRSFRQTKTDSAVFQLVQALNLESELIRADSKAQNRMVFHNDQVKRITKAVSPTKVGFILLKELFARGTLITDLPSYDESIHSFFSRHIGENLTDSLVDPLVSGIFAGDAKQLSVMACKPFKAAPPYEVLGKGSLMRGLIKSQLGIKSKADKKAEKKRTEGGDEPNDDTSEPSEPLNSTLQALLKKGPSSFSFKQGLGTLTQSMQDALQQHDNVQLLCDSPVQTIYINTDGKPSIVQYKNNLDDTHNELEFDHVICALPSNIAGQCIQPSKQQSRVQQRHSVSLSGLLSSIHHTKLAAVSFGIEHKAFPFNEKLKGFGYLVPSSTNQPILGCLMESVTFPQQQPDNVTRLTAMVGGDTNPAILDNDDNELIEMCRKTLASHLQLELTANNSNNGGHALSGQNTTELWGELKRCTLPQYHVGHNQLMNKIAQIVVPDFPTLHLVGNSYKGVSIPDVVRSSYSAAQAVHDRVSVGATKAV